MSSFLKEVLITDKNENNEFFEKIVVIRKEIRKLKSVINESMKDDYVKLDQNLKPNKILLHKCEKLIDDMNILENRINDQVIAKLNSSSKELQDLSLELKEYNYSLNIADLLLEIHKGIESIETFEISEKDKQYITTASTLIRLHHLIFDKNYDIQHLNIYTCLKEEYCKLYDNFVEKLSFLWQEKIFWDDTQELTNIKSFSLHVRCCTDELIDIIQALHCINKLTRYVESLSTKLLQHFISPIIRFDCKVEKTDESFMLEIVDKREMPAYKAVLTNLQLLFEFLHQHFSIHINSKEYFLNKLSNSLFSEFSNLLTTECIAKIIPTSTVELETFKNTVAEIETFQNFLIDSGFITEEQKFLSKYTNNIDELYINKKIEKLLGTARTIMKKDLHDSFRYTLENNEELILNESVMKDDNGLSDRKLDNFFFHLPDCQISKSAQEILYLIQEILEEASLCSERYFIKLFYTSRNIFEMYATLVPEIHKSYLETIPQQVALFHNNCMYLSHHLLILSYKYKKKRTFPETFSMTYVDQCLLLRQVGSKCFLNHMKYQRDMIFSILRESGLSLIGQTPELPVTTERALRQCIRQLELLKTVWIEILPFKMYCRVLGCIVNDMIDDIITKVINVEDIPANVASELVTLFNMVIKRIPPIFPQSALVEQLVQKWRKLKELIIVLGASLKEIEDRWADGKGPLANEFSPQHVKQLIRALFQNTERRSHLLSKIKEK